MGYLVRAATLDDADALGRVHAQVWRETYAGILSDEWIARVSDDERVERWKRILGEPGAGRQWVVEVDGHPVGFSASGPSRDDPPVRDHELWSIHLLRSHWRMGLGTALAEAAIGTRPASLWVIADNLRAREFYRAIGFEVDGAEHRLAYWENVREIRMVR